MEGSVVAISNMEDDSHRVKHVKRGTTVECPGYRQQLTDGWIEGKDKKDLVGLGRCGLE